MTYMNFLDIVADFFDSCIAGSSDYRGDNVHINHTGARIHSTLLHGRSDQTHALLNILRLDFLAQAHLCQSLSDTDQRLKLPWCRSNCLCRVAH